MKNDQFPDRLIQSYVLDKYFVSTAYRQCSAMEASNVWYYETTVLNWDKETRKTGNIYKEIIRHVLNQEDSGYNPKCAIRTHISICEELLQESGSI